MKKGFTLIELMVTVTIMMIMTAVVFFGYNQFNESSLLNSFAYDMSLTIRQAQVYGVAAKESGSTQSAIITTTSMSNFNAAYGVHFDNTVNAIPLGLFIDANLDGNYVAVDDGQFLQSYKFQRGIKIVDLCATVAGSQDVCGSNLDITFKRPNPEAIVSVDGVPEPNASVTRIVLYNADESMHRSVLVYSTGQIAVQ